MIPKITSTFAFAGGLALVAATGPAQVQDRAPLTLVIGSATGPVGLDFSTVVGLASDAQGHIYVGDEQAREIRIFTPAGKLSRTIGRRGAGPAEFETISGIEVAGSSLYVVDNRLRKVSVINLDDGTVRSTLRLAGLHLPAPKGGGGPVLAPMVPSRCSNAGSRPIPTDLSHPSSKLVSTRARSFDQALSQSRDCQGLITNSPRAGLPCGSGCRSLLKPAWPSRRPAWCTLQTAMSM
ncbi:MAG: 6-bladed beta-propeller [Longimicrobiales bacterium]